MSEKYVFHKQLPVHFYRNENGREPVRDWLKSLGRPDTVVIGEDIRVVQKGWPVGLPVCRPMGDGCMKSEALCRTGE